MARLAPRVVGEAARSLFRTGHGESIEFFYLKACGVTPERWIHLTSSETLPDELVRIAGQPEGFADLVKANVSRLSPANEYGFPTPQTRVTDYNNYSFYWPITEEAQYILRKNHLNRSIIWTNLRAGLTNTAGRSPAVGITGTHVTLSDVFQLREPEDGTKGCDIRLQHEPDYVMHASWYFGPKSGIPMKVPLRPLAIWMHRTDDLDQGTTVDELVRRTVDLLHLTPAELYRLFDRTYLFPLGDDAYTDAWDIEDYFAALCLPHDVQPVRLPTIGERDVSMDLDRWRFLSGALGLTQGVMVDDPQVIADSLISLGKRNVLLYGPPRTGKTHTASTIAARYLDTSTADLASDSRFTQIQFHQGWSYGDFIRKLIPVPAGSAIAFRREPGIFLDHCTTNATGRSVFVIEEINRANLASVFGEAFQVIEEGYRGRAIDLPGSLETDEVKTLTIPPDLLLLATANDRDRSTLQMDFAFLSRFATVACPVSYETIFATLSGTSGWDQTLAERFVLLLREVEAICGYPIGHANFYGFGAPASVSLWYKTALRTILRLYLTDYRGDELVQVDTLFADWDRSLL